MPYRTNRGDTAGEFGFPHHVRVDDDGGLPRSGWAMCEAARALSTQRFGRLIGTATEQTTGAITDQLALWLECYRRLLADDATSMTGSSVDAEAGFRRWALCVSGPWNKAELSSRKSNPSRCDLAPGR
ncbi:type II toxin-antitoxin system PemK/MazF family toxin [Haloactinomyces albus]|uniref:Uncharacterized protein n=1 Tax=Haloactinomyces albus TaxID=1352928 RepID=A0AAE3ZFJ6_9ACTN|nr:type II toxin-antitoxin system PemK/MazF family toxin [Haloactinomyces albus]MDR7302956.1 hypothetical protein [Haloactinomyces albus]